MTNIKNVDADTPACAAGQLRRHGLFASIPEDVLTEVVAGTFEARREGGQYFFREGDHASHYLFMTEGRVDMVRTGIDGQERVARFFEPGELVAEAAMFMAHGRYPMSARAAQQAVAWCLPRAQLHAACLQHPPLALRMLEALSARLYGAVNEVSSFALADAPQRLAAYLLAQVRLQASVRLELPLATHQLAGHLGVRPETLSRIFAQWAQQGYVAGRGRVWELRDLEALRQFAQAVVRSG